MSETPLQNAVREFLAFLNLERGARPNTAKHYGLDLRLFLDFLGEEHPEIHSPGAVERRHIRAFLAYLRAKRGNSHRSCARRLASLNSFFKFLLENGDVTSNPCMGIRRPKFQPPLPRVMSQKEAEAFLEAAASATKHPKRDEAMFRLFLQTGCRLSELIAVRPLDIDLDTGRIRYIGKGSKERWVPLTPKTLGALTRYMDALAAEAGAHPLEARPAEPLFRNARGKPIDPHVVYRAFNQCIEAAGLAGRGFTPHKLRHTCLTLLLEAGTDLRTLQEIAGHTSVEATQIYTHVSSERTRNAMDRHPLG